MQFLDKYAINYILKHKIDNDYAKGKTLTE